MAFIAPALPFLALAGSVISAFGTMQAAAGQQSAMEYQAQIERQKAEQARAAAAVQAQLNDRQARRKYGEVIAAFSGAGVDTDEGSPLEVLSDTITEAQESHALTLHKGEVAAINSENQANLDIFQGTLAWQAGMGKAFGTLAGGLTSFAGPSGANISSWDFGGGGSSGPVIPDYSAEK